MRWLLPVALLLCCACGRTDVAAGSGIDAACAGQCDLVQTSWTAGNSDVVVQKNANGFLCANHLMDTSDALVPMSVIDFTPQGHCERGRFDFDGADALSGWTVDRWSLAPGLDGSGMQSDVIADSESATLSRTLRGPAWLQFWADVSSEGGYDMLTVTSDAGASVQLSGVQPWTLSGVEIPVGDHVVSFTYSKDSGAVQGLDRALIDSLTVLENAPMSAWRPSGCPFLVDEAESALRAGSCGPTLQKESAPNVPPSSIEFEVFGPAQLQFDWRPSSEIDSDYLRLSIDDEVRAEISGTIADWAHVELPLGARRHTVRFFYTKDSGTDDGEDTGWIDNLTVSGHCFSGAELTSQWFDAGTPVTVDSVWWDADTPANTSVNVRVRTAPSPAASEATPWFNCRPVAWGGAAEGACAPEARYVQYHVQLTCEPWAEPPSLRGVGIRWR